MNRQDIELLKEIEQRGKSNTKRLDEHDKKLEELTKAMMDLNS